MTIPKPSNRFVPNFDEVSETRLNLPPSEVEAPDSDNVSYLSSDTQSSLASRVRSRMGEIISDSMSILAGEPVDAPDADSTAGVVVVEESKPRLFIVQEDSSDQEPAVDFLQDHHRTMTWGRRIALNWSRKGWYNPHAETEDDAISQEMRDDLSLQMRPAKITKKEIPSLAKAWAYFEHFALPRHLVEENQDQHDLKRAEPGESEQETKLYDPLCTPLSQMGDFGLGVGLYFSTLRALAILTLLAGLLNIPNFMYFSGDDYSDSQPGVTDLMKGSAICTRQSWVPCENCTEEQYTQSGRWALGTIQSFNPIDFYPINLTEFPFEDGVAECILEDDILIAINSTTNETIPGATCKANQLPFSKKNECDGATFEQGMINYGTLLLILVGILVMNFYQIRMEVEFDEDEQTAQDYSIRIQNPPADATDPSEWRKYFKEKFGAHATVVTIALDNDPLVRALRERRECVRKIELQVEPGTSLDTLTLAKLASEEEFARGFFGKLLAMVVPGIPEFFGRMAELEAKIKGWAQLEYDVSNVFVSFETEAEQRSVLSELVMGAYHVKRQNKAAIDAKYLFRDDLILNIKEPDEPNTIRWADLNVKAIDKLKPLATTTTFSLLFILLIALLIQFINGMNPGWAAIAIAVFNSIFPMFAKMLTDIERHSSEGLKQTSLYVKIAVFRWVNTAIVITIISPFTVTLDDGTGLIPSIYAIFFAEIATTNAIQILDPMGHVNRHYLAPRAHTQDAMNLKMQGAEVELAERYTNMTKLLFLALWYCSVFPGALFMCSFALFVNYYTDRFSLMRTWKRLPQLGTNISMFSRRYFFSICVVAMAVVSAYFWSGFPFDNLCSVETIDAAYEGTWILDDISGVDSLVLTTESESYRHCLQDYLRYGNWTFPALARWQPEGSEWMTADQELLVNIYGITSLAVLGLVMIFFGSLAVGAMHTYFATTGYDHCGDDQGVHFSQVHSISAYVPQVDSPSYAYPLLACSVDGIHPDLFDWTDPDRPHVYYDLTIDADELLGDLSVRGRLVFSLVSHAPVASKGGSSKKLNGDSSGRKNGSVEF